MSLDMIVLTVFCGSSVCSYTCVTHKEVLVWSSQIRVRNICHRLMKSSRH